MRLVVTWHNGDQDDYEIDRDTYYLLISCNIYQTKIKAECGRYLNLEYVREYYLEEKK